jgi:hypothetical protein
MKAPGRTALDLGIYVLAVLQVIAAFIELMNINYIIFTNPLIPYTSIGPYATLGPMAAASLYGGFDWFILTMGPYKIVYITLPALLITVFSKRPVTDTQNSVSFAIVYILFVIGALLEIIRIGLFSYVIFFGCSSFWYCVSFNPLDPAGQANVQLIILYILSLLWLLLIAIDALLVVGLSQTVVAMAEQNALLGKYENFGSKAGRARKEIEELYDNSIDSD